jgi:hypothetical protein
MNSIMDTKLTLTVNKDIVESAKEIARESGRSLSDLVEHYLRSMVLIHKSKGKHYPLSGESNELNAADSESLNYSSRLLSLRGSMRDDGGDYKEELGKIRSKKYLK